MVNALKWLSKIHLNAIVIDLGSIQRTYLVQRNGTILLCPSCRGNQYMPDITPKGEFRVMSCIKTFVTRIHAHDGVNRKYLQFRCKGSSGIPKTVCNDIENDKFESHISKCSKIETGVLVVYLI